MTPDQFYLVRSGIGWKMYTNNGYHRRPWWGPLAATGSVRTWFFTRHGALRKLRRALYKEHCAGVPIPRSGFLSRIPLEDLRLRVR